jgi:hypothetical protein
MLFFRDVSLCEPRSMRSSRRAKTLPYQVGNASRIAPVSAPSVVTSQDDIRLSEMQSGDRFHSAFDLLADERERPWP